MSFVLSGACYFPSPLPQLAKRGGSSAERHPCESCGCGCSSAAYCWDKCCCHTDEEKLDWAAKNQVQPPKFLVERVAKSTANKSLSASKPRLPACCAAKQEGESKAVSRQQGNLERGSIVLMWKAAECRGLKLLWSALSIGIIDSGSPTMLDAKLSVLDVLSIEDQLAQSTRFSPDPPVP